MNRTTAIILILLSIGIYYSFISPQYAAAKAVADQAAQYKSVLADVSRIKEARDNLLSSYESIPQTEKDRLMKVLPDNVDAVGLARDLDTIAAQYGISIASVQVDNNTNAAAPSTGIVLPDYALPYDKATVSFSFISDYDHFSKFLADLEKNLRIMDIDSLAFTVSDTNGLYEHKITVQTYWLK